MTLEVVQAVVDELGSGKVGIRISPTGTFNTMTDSDPETLFNILVEKLNPFKLAYLHVVENFGEQDKDNFDFYELRKRFEGTYIGNGGYTGQTAEESIALNKSDFIAFGMPFISNPDLPLRIKEGAPLNETDQNTLYGGDERGYIDYPFLQNETV